LITGIVFAGGFAQAATGVGFGIVAGPFLIEAFGYDAGLALICILSVASAGVSLATVNARPQARELRVLALSLPIGVALGIAVDRVLETSSILMLYGGLLVILGATLLVRVARSDRPETPQRSGDESGVILKTGGVIAGVCAFLFGAPGPIAAWALAHGRQPARRIQATLSLYFVIAYPVVALLLYFTGRFGNPDPVNLVAQSCVCIAGSLAGMWASRRLSQRMALAAIAMLVIFAGLSMLA
jgi:uncharacterized membrane protein YfcA